ncbi:hypothetical protein POX_c04632 [Penicillium oxalicum]|uniref:hypothetical protein n=2 Tax=Penicillium oxalicum TaxID=69781 RepID=UPI0020B6882F|nr:hypothetical protein POX_c04632 [Penicillium oxalicum]KAI2791754.1 hypothetical protein POX_c04632 [Penicillium oxalicum]
MTGARKRSGAASGKYSDRLEQAFKYGPSSRPGIWSIEGSDAESMDEGDLRQTGSQSEDEIEDATMKEDGDEEDNEQNWVAVPQEIISTPSNKVSKSEYPKTSLELALACMADLDKRQQ